MHSWVVDIILKVLFHQACWQFGLEDKVAVIAVGGYGRGEMAPFSDVDIMFLSSKTITPAQTKTIEFILYILWDLGLKVGHSTHLKSLCLRHLMIKLS